MYSYIALNDTNADTATSYISVNDLDTICQGDIFVDDDADPGWYDSTHVKTI